MIEIIIPEEVIPAVRMTTRSKWVDPAARAYLSSKQVLRWYMQQAMDAGDHKMYDKEPLCCKIVFEVTHLHKDDLDNKIKSVLDAAQGIVFKNDNYVDSIDAYRVLANNPRVTLKVWNLDTDSEWRQVDNEWHQENESPT